MILCLPHGNHRVLVVEAKAQGRPTWSRCSRCVGSDDGPRVWLEAEAECGWKLRADKALQAGPQCSLAPSVGPAPKEPCLSRWVEVTLSPLLCTGLDVLSEWTRIYAQVFS